MTFITYLDHAALEGGEGDINNKDVGWCLRHLIPLTVVSSCQQLVTPSAQLRPLSSISTPTSMV